MHTKYVQYRLVLILMTLGGFFYAQNFDSTKIAAAKIMTKYASVVYSTDFDDKKTYAAKVEAGNFNFYAGHLSCGNMFSKFSNPQFTLTSSGYQVPTLPNCGGKVDLRSSPVTNDTLYASLGYSGILDITAFSSEDNDIKFCIGKTIKTANKRKIQTYIGYARTKLEPKTYDSWLVDSKSFMEGFYSTILLETSFTGHYFSTYNCVGFYENPRGGVKRFYRNQNILDLTHFILGVGYFFIDDNVITNSQSMTRLHTQFYINPTIQFNIFTTKFRAGVYSAYYSKETNDKYETLYKEAKIIAGMQFLRKHSNFALKVGLSGIALDSTTKELSNSKIDVPTWTYKLSYRLFALNLSLTDTYIPERNSTTTKNIACAIIHYNINHKHYLLSLGTTGTLTHKDDNLDKALEVNASLKLRSKHLWLMGKVTGKWTW